MTLDPNILASDPDASLEKLEPTLIEAEAVTRIADAYANYCVDAESNMVAISSVAITTAKPLMAAAMLGISAVNQGAAKITQGCVAFWASVAVGLAASFTGATAITPPPFPTLIADLTAEFAALTAEGASLVDAALRVATKIHNQTIAGGTVTFPAGTFPIL